MAADKRTGLRKPKQHLKTWGDPQWTCRLTPRLSVGMVDEELPFGKEGGRKSWYITITQDRDLLTELGPVVGVPKKGKTLLLSEDDVIALVRYLEEGELVSWDEEGRVVNGQLWPDNVHVPDLTVERPRTRKTRTARAPKR